MEDIHNVHLLNDAIKKSTEIDNSIKQKLNYNEKYIISLAKLHINSTKLYNNIYEKLNIK